LVAGQQDLAKVEQAVDGFLYMSDGAGRRTVAMFHLSVAPEKGDIVGSSFDAQDETFKNEDRSIRGERLNCGAKVNRAPAISTARLRPMRSASSPPASAPMSAPRVTQLVTTSIISGLGAKVFLMPVSAPEMTP
jgi:hypothetical protein